MQKEPQEPNWTENADNADEAEIVQHAYCLRFANEIRRMHEGLAERGVLSRLSAPPVFNPNAPVNKAGAISFMVDSHPSLERRFHVLVFVSVV
jgi:hypothetical protein